MSVELRLVGRCRCVQTISGQLPGNGVLSFWRDWYCGYEAPENDKLLEMCDRELRRQIDITHPSVICQSFLHCLVLVL